MAGRTSESLQPVYEIDLPTLDPGGVIDIRNKLRNYLNVNAPPGSWNLDVDVHKRKIVVRSTYAPLLSKKTLRQGLDQSITRVGFGEGYELTTLPIASREAEQRLVELEAANATYEQRHIQDQQTIADNEERERRLTSEKQTLEERIARVISEKEGVERQLRSTRQGYDERIVALQTSLRGAETTIDELRKGTVPDEVLLERYLFDPEAMTTFYLEIGHRRLKSLVQAFKDFKEKRQRAIFERAVREVDISLAYDEYQTNAPQISLSWEATELYIRLKPEFDKAVEGIDFLNGLRTHTRGQDIPDDLRELIERNVEPKRREYNATIDGFQRAERRHRELSSLGERISSLSMEEKTDGAIVDQQIIYVIALTPEGSLELHVPLDEELAETYLGSLLLSQLDKLGQRISNERFLIYQVNPQYILSSQNEYGFYRLGIRLSIVSFMGYTPRERTLKVTAPELTGLSSEETRTRVDGMIREDDQRIVNAIKILKEAGRDTTPTNLATELGVPIARLYKHLNPLLRMGIIGKVRRNRNVFYDVL